MKLPLMCVLGAFLVTSAPEASACTAFTATCGSTTLVGNNEDFNNPRTRIWFVPGSAKELGRMYVGYDNGSPQGGMNEAGLFFDGFAVERVAAKTTDASTRKPRFEGVLMDKAMAECRTVDDVVRLFEQYDRSFLESGVLMFVDKSGDAVAIETDAIARKKGPWFVQTNFRQSRTPESAISCPRFQTATRMLKEMAGCASIEGFRKVLAATSAEGGEYPTLYSNLYELDKGVMHLYYFRDFDHPKTIRLADELKLGPHTIEMASLFPDNAPARAFAEAREREIARRVVVVDDAVLAAYAGRYKTADGVVVVIRKEGAKLTAETPGPSVVDLLPESQTTFFVPGMPVKVMFLSGASGKVERLDILYTLSGAGAPMSAQRLPSE
jgi:hypothetical protein